MLQRDFIHLKITVQKRDVCQLFPPCAKKPLFAMRMVLADNGAGCYSQVWKPNLFQLRDSRVSDAPSQVQQAFCGNNVGHTGSVWKPQCIKVTQLMIRPIFSI